MNGYSACDVIFAGLILAGDLCCMFYPHLFLWFLPAFSYNSLLKAKNKQKHTKNKKNNGHAVYMSVLQSKYC